MKKLLRILLITLTLLTMVGCLIACNETENKEPPKYGTMEEVGYNLDDSYVPTLTSIPTLDELGLPEFLKTADSGVSRFGLQSYDKASNSWKSFLFDSDFPFDTTLPTIIFIHGMGGNDQLRNYKAIADSGYNMLCFYWGAFSREDNIDMPTVAEKLWFYDDNKRYADDERNWHVDENLNYSVIEIMSTFYLELFKRYPNYSGSQISVLGHSYGGMMTFGFVSYITTAFKSGLINASVLPDSIYYLDPYLMPIKNTTKHIRWLGDITNPYDEGGVMLYASRAVKDAKALGISQTFYRSSEGVALPAKLLAPKLYDEIRNDCLHINADSTYLYSGLDAMSWGHIYAIVWPGYTTWQTTDAFTNDTELGCGLFNPYEQLYSRNGVEYKIDYNNTDKIFDDDEISSVNIQKSKISGFVYVDANANNVMDERIGKHFYGANVTIKDADGNVILNTTTTINGYYEVEVEQGTYTITVTVPEEYSLTENTTSVTVNSDYQLDTHTWGIVKK